MLKINGIDVEKLLKKSGELKDHEEEFKFLRRSYIGGQEYRNGEYLIRHKREIKSSFKRRLKSAVYTNYVAPIIDIYNSYLHREKPNRDRGSINRTLWEAYMKDADLNGNDHQSVMRDVSFVSSLYGLVGILVDTPSTATGNLGVDVSSGIHTFVKLYTPENIIHLKYSFATGRPELDIVVLNEDFDDGSYKYYIIYTKNEFYRIRRKRDSYPEIIAEGTHSLGYVPFIVHKNKGSILEETGASDVIDIAELNRRVYQLDSTALEIMENTAFPFLEVPKERSIGGNKEDVVIGTTNVLEFDPEKNDGRHKWVEPQGHSLAEILKWRNQALEDIRYHSKIGGTDSIKSRSAMAGVSLELVFQQLNAVLSGKAEGMERTESSIFRTVADANNSTWGGVVKYPRRFGVRDLSFELDQALKVDSLIDSPSFRKAVGIDAARRTLGDDAETEVVLKDIKSDIENSSGTSGIPSASVNAMNGG